jgi:hypothetical protein
MKANVRIEARERGKLVAVREVHNVWTAFGHQFLAEVIALTAIDPDVFERNDKIKYIGWGMGGEKQNQRTMVTAFPLSVIYPLGSTPHGSTGFTFREDYTPNITSLELPAIYGSVAAGDSDKYTTPGSSAWRRIISDSDHSASHPAPNVLRFYDAARNGTFATGHPLAGNQYAYMPLSEAGLFLDDLGLSGVPFTPPVAYVTFDTIQMSDEMDLYTSWDVTF